MRKFLLSKSLWRSKTWLHSTPWLHSKPSPFGRGQGEGDFLNDSYLANSPRSGQTNLQPFGVLKKNFSLQSSRRIDQRNIDPPLRPHQPARLPSVQFLTPPSTRLPVLSFVEGRFSYPPRRHFVPPIARIRPDFCCSVTRPCYTGSIVTAFSVAVPLAQRAGPRAPPRSGGRAPFGTPISRSVPKRRRNRPLAARSEQTSQFRSARAPRIARNYRGSAARSC